MRKSIYLVLMIFLATTCYSQKSNSIIDTRDGNVYKTIQIGNQIWFAENLNYDSPAGFKSKVNLSNVSENNDTTFYNYYLYDWPTALNVCPNGWKLPSKVDFDILINSVDTSEVKTNNPLTVNGTSGFNSLTGSLRDHFWDPRGIWWIGDGGDMWTSSEGNENMALNLSIQCKYLRYYQTKKTVCFSVRCIKIE